jgi:hypothetical protein
VRTRARIVLAGAAVVVALLLSPAAPATTAYSDHLSGTEIVPITSTLGTFVGVATGDLPAAWRVQIKHQALATGSTVAITGGTFALVTRSGRKLTGPVTAGSVSVTNRGSRCTNQTYRVVAALEIGSFVGTLTHRRRSILGRCIIYAATIDGTGSFSV